MTNSQTIIETALLLLIAFLIGCAVGYLLRRALAGAPAKSASASPAEPFQPAAAPLATAVTPPAAAAPVVVAKPVIVAKPVAVAKPPVAKPPVAKPSSSARPSAAQRLAAAAAEPAAPAEKARTAPARKTPAAGGPKAPAEPATPAPDGKPAGLPGPRGGKKDDLRQIKGIGPKTEATLNGLGIYHFDQIAAWDGATISWIDNHLAFSGRIAREAWVAQAKARK